MKLKPHRIAILLLVGWTLIASALIIDHELDSYYADPRKRDYDYLLRYRTESWLQDMDYKPMLSELIDRLDGKGGIIGFQAATYTFGGTTTIPDNIHLVLDNSCIIGTDKDSTIIIFQSPDNINVKGVTHAKTRL
jgi:hypothetical protein